MIRRQPTLGTLVLAAGLLAAPALRAADPSPQASGTFTSRAWEVKTVGAYAFPAAETGLDDAPGIKVAVASAGFLPERMDRIWDREARIDDLYHQDGDLVVFFHFAPDGRYRGLSYYFESGDGCGFCFDGNVRSTVKVEKGRIHGRLQSPEKVDEGDPVFDITFDVPIAPSDYGTALPADGGAPGAAYAAYHRALAASNADGLRPLLEAADAESLAQQPEAVVAALRDRHPTASYRVTRGFVRGEHALLLVAGENAYGRIDGEAHLVLVDGSWRVDQEISKPHMGE